MPVHSAYNRISLLIFLVISFAASLLVSLFVAGCAPSLVPESTSPNTSENADGIGKYSNVSFRTERASGVIDGQSWDFVSGLAQVSPFESAKLQIDLWNLVPSGNVCQASGAIERKVMFSVPNQVGTYPLSSAMMFTLYSFSNGVSMNRAITKGAITILEITDSEVSGLIAGEFDGANRVNGSFRVPHCRAQ
jgi:hypothetical protein